MSDGGSLQPDPLFVGLTRPTMIFGVSVSYAMLNIMISCVWFINSSNFSIVFLALIVHGIGYIACFKEPKFMELYMIKMSKCNQCPNRGYYGANSYSV